MESFAECIRQYLHNQDISYSNAAKLCGIDRTILGRYANGSRKPQNKEIVSKLADGLQMSEEDREKLYKAYKRTRIVEDYHTDYTTITSIVENKHIIRRPSEYVSVYKTKIFSEESASDLYAKEEILDAIRCIKKMHNI